MAPSIFDCEGECLGWKKWDIEPTWGRLVRVWGRRLFWFRSSSGAAVLLRQTSDLEKVGHPHEGLHVDALDLDHATIDELENSFQVLVLDFRRHYQYRVLGWIISQHWLEEGGRRWKNHLVRLKADTKTAASVSDFQPEMALPHPFFGLPFSIRGSTLCFGSHHAEFEISFFFW